MAAAILLIAFGLRTVGITTAPPGLSGDEGINAADALNVWRFGTAPIFFTNNYGREAGFIYMMALSMKLIGANVLGIRLPAIVCGATGVLLSFVLLHRLWNLRVAALGTTLMGISFWPIFISRIGLRAVSMLPLQALAAYSLWRGLQSKCLRAGLKWWLTLGASLGLVTYTYIPGRIFPVVLVGWVLLMWILSPAERRPQIARHLPALGLAILVALIIFAPFGIFILKHPDQANQRVQELSGVVNSLRAGNLRPLLRTTVRTLGMFTFVGDQYWRYNIENRPVFDWATGLLFYAGVALCVARIRQPRNQLLLLWLGLMLTPSILAPGSPSFLRATGAIIPIYAMPAIALDAVADRLVGRDRPQGSLPTERWVSVAVMAGMLAVGIRDGIAYFVTWPNTPRVREVYTAGLAQVGRQLSRLKDGGHTVLVGCDFASDYARDMVRFQTSYTGPIRWFTGRSAMVFPSPSMSEADAYYLLADALPPEALIGPVAARAEALYLAQSQDGAFESAGYRLSTGARAVVPWQPATSLTGRFQDALAVVGYTAPQEVERGSDASFLLVWKVPTTYEVDRSEALWFHLELRDAVGNVWDTRANLLPYASWEWHPGDVVAQWLTVPVAADIPPGQVTLEFAVEKAQTPLPFSAPGRPVADAALLGPVTVVGAPISEVQDDAVRLGIDQEIALNEAAIIGVALPGDTLHATFSWQAAARAETDYAVRLRVREKDCQGTPVYSELLPLWPNRYPTSRWLPGERIRSFHHPQLPRDLAVGAYAVTIDLVPSSSDTGTAPTASAQACYPLEIVGHRRRFDVPAMDVRLDQPLSDSVTLIGYRFAPDLQEVAPGNPMEITLVWQATGEPTQSYTVFTHLYGPDGTLVTQHDSVPCGGACPTSSWIRDEVVADTHTLSVPLGAEAGTYTLGIGMYNGKTLERLTIPESDNNLISIPGPVLR